MKLKDVIDAKEKELVEGLRRSAADDLKELQRGPNKVEIAAVIFTLAYIVFVVTL